MAPSPEPAPGPNARQLPLHNREPRYTASPSAQGSARPRRSAASAPCPHSNIDGGSTPSNASGPSIGSAGCRTHGDGRGGPRVGWPRCSRIFRATAASSIVAISSMRPEHDGHVSTSIPKLRFISVAQSSLGGFPPQIDFKGGPERATDHRARTRCLLLLVMHPPSRDRVPPPRVRDRDIVQR